MKTQPVSLRTLFWVFFRIACTSFGGFMSMISVIENVVVERKKLLRHEEMLDGVSLASLLPGPIAVNVVVYVGYRLRGTAGALVSAAAAILPAFVVITTLSAAYFQWGQIPAVSKLFAGFIPAVAAVIVSAAWNMSRKSIAGVREGTIALAAGAALLLIGGFYSTALIILAAGIAGWFLFRGAESGAPKPGGRPAISRRPKLHANMFLLGTTSAGVAPFFALEPSLTLKLLVLFGGMSVMLFGGGYVFIPLIQQVVVDGQGWVTRQEFVDGIAMGQITPGPILVSAAFIGYKVAGLLGALAATVGIFTPPALIMVASSNGLERVRHSVTVRAALRGIRPAVVGLIFAAAVVVANTAAPALASVAIFGLALFVLTHWRIEVVWIIPAAGIAGLLLY